MYLFDTFEGMPSPTAQDVDFKGRDAASQVVSGNPARRPELALRLAGGRAAGGPEHGLRRGAGALREGEVEDTLPDRAPQQISLLRLDTDWYDSTRHELRHLYPRLARAGVLILDDYGHWQGARQATDEYLAEQRIPLQLNRIDRTARIALKP